MTDLPLGELPWVARHGLLVGAGIWVLLALAGVALLWWWARRKGRAHARQVRDAFGRAERDAAALESTEGAVLAGRLVLAGKPVERFDDGAPVAAATVEESTRPLWFSTKRGRWGRPARRTEQRELPQDALFAMRSVHERASGL